MRQNKKTKKPVSKNLFKSFSTKLSSICKRPAERIKRFSGDLNRKIRGIRWTGSRILDRRKILYYGLTGFFMISIVLVVIFSTNVYQQYRKTLLETQKILEVQKRYEVQNFANREFNYLEIPENKDIRPGQVLDFRIYFRNTGVLTAHEFKISVTIPENTELVESVIDSYAYDISSGSAVFEIGDLPQGSGGDLYLSFRIKSPLPDGTQINAPDLRFIYIKEASLIGKKGIYYQDFSNDEDFKVDASPDFSQSRITIEGQGMSCIRQNQVSYGDMITYRIDIINSGDMDAENIEVTVKNLDNLELVPEDNPDFLITGKEAFLDIGSLKTRDEKSFRLVAHVDDNAENNSVISPVVDLVHGKSSFEFKSQESILKLYPSFESSNVTIAARSGAGVYSGDIVDVTVNIKNTGDIEAKNLIAKLIYSDVFTPEDGETEWFVEKLSIGETVTFNTSLIISAELEKDTKAGCTLNISSDEVPEIQKGGSSILISGEKPFTRNVIPIVALHGIEAESKSNYELSTGQFDALCSILKSYGYKTITFLDLIAYIDGKKQLPEKPVIITSDDGYQSIYTYAFPILKKYGYTMTVFLATGYIGSSEVDRKLNDFDRSLLGIVERPMLIWPEVAAMSQYGIEFQSHGVTHRNIGSLSESDAYFEISQSKSDIESHLGKPCLFIAWPHGSSSGYAKSILPETGYRGGVGYGQGKNENVESIDLNFMKRITLFYKNPPSSYPVLLKLYR